MKIRKFKIGDRVKLVSMNNTVFYDTALCKIDDTGTVINVEKDACICEIEFDRLKRENKPARLYILEADLVFENRLINCE